MITVTEQAGNKVKTLLEAEQKTASTGGLRIYVSGGGCHGFQYGLSIEEQSREEDTVIDYLDGLQGAGFAIKNPNAKSSCGCGSSFSA